MDDLQPQFASNAFGLVVLIKAVLPLREVALRFVQIVRFAISLKRRAQLRRSPLHFGTMWSILV